MSRRWTHWRYMFWNFEVGNVSMLLRSGQKAVWLEIERRYSRLDWSGSVRKYSMLGYNDERRETSNELEEANNERREAIDKRREATDWLLSACGGLTLASDEFDIESAGDEALKSVILSEPGCKHKWYSDCWIRSCTMKGTTVEDSFPDASMMLFSESYIQSNLLCTCSRTLASSWSTERASGSTTDWRDSFASCAQYPSSKSNWYSSTSKSSSELLISPLVRAGTWEKAHLFVLFKYLSAFVSGSCFLSDGFFLLERVVFFALVM